jgi:hypothetical protein
MKHKSFSLATLAVLLSFGSIAAAQSEPEQFIGEGTIVAFQKYNRHPEKPYQRGMGNFVEQWIVRIDRWEAGTKSPGYFLVSYDQVSVRALSDKEINQSKWRFTFREPIFHEAESCAGNAPLPSEQGATAVHFRPARIEDFRRTDQGRSDVFPALKDLPCLIANKPPTEATAQERKNGNVASPKISGEDVDDGDGFTRRGSVA